ncbi:hypothetical protein AA103587_0485 [Gluconobacter kanchanaburiensis NBRC 103587]|nr:hypothetical protein AA103587_0485 [Gluconobacter kanchanaburiensis NBRC 103587]
MCQIRHGRFFVFDSPGPERFMTSDGARRTGEKGTQCKAAAAPATVSARCSVRTDGRRGFGT